MGFFFCQGLQNNLLTPAVHSSPVSMHVGLVTCSSTAAMCCSKSGKLAGYGIQPNIKSLPDTFWQMNLLCSLG